MERMADYWERLELYNAKQRNKVLKLVKRESDNIYTPEIVYIDIKEVA